jgi:hypothetical protein
LQNSDAKLQLYYLKKYNKSFSLEMTDAQTVSMIFLSIKKKKKTLLIVPNEALIFEEKNTKAYFIINFVIKQIAKLVIFKI